MRRSIMLLALCGAALAPLARSYEYPLQFTPNAGFRGLVVAGYEIANGEVVGNCSYYTMSGGSGKGGGRGAIKQYPQTCTWDLFGNLVSVQKGAPVAPPALYTKGTQVVYAASGSNYTGTDSKLPERGFVNSPGAHYTWLTPASNAVIHQFVYTLQVVLKSDGDIPVDINSVTVSALHGVATLKGTTCDGEIKVGNTCSITVTYDPTKLTSNTGLAADTLRIDVNSDAGEAHDYIQKLTIIVPQKP
ncbi:MAG TPA: hypothetical protein VKU02_15315 [Gemmataceae bacterium]|nr:hypothetical protein [Gemmataceae bacterium]